MNLLYTCTKMYIYTQIPMTAADLHLDNMQFFMDILYTYTKPYIYTQIPMAAADLQLDNMRVDGAKVRIVAVNYRVDGGPPIAGMLPGAAIEDYPPQIRYSTVFSWRPSIARE